MKILVAPDSYKGCLSAKEVAVCMEQGIKDVLPDAEVIKIPMADGGEGTVEAIISSTGGQLHTVEVVGPLGEPVNAIFGVLPDRQTAVIEMAAASGITLVPGEKLNPLITTTYGTGQLITAALDLGCRDIIIGLGGSATNDGGVGVAQALGVRFLDDQGAEIGHGGGQLRNIRNIDVSGMDPRIAQCRIRIATDVTNPLCGPEGASAVFGPQKGATPEMVATLEEGMQLLSRLIHSQLGMDISHVSGAGAAGGLGAGLMVFANGQITPGIDLVLELTEFAHHVRDVDLVITGEGHTDSQTAYGKAPAEVLRAAKTVNKPVICVSEGVSSDVQSLYQLGMDAIIGVTQSPMTLEDAMRQAPLLIRNAVANVMRIMITGQRLPYAHSNF